MSRQCQGKVKVKSRQGQDKVKIRSGQVHGKVKARSRRGSGKAKAKSKDIAISKSVTGHTHTKCYMIQPQTAVFVDLLLK